MRPFLQLRELLGCQQGGMGLQIEHLPALLTMMEAAPVAALEAWPTKPEKERED